MNFYKLIKKIKDIIDHYDVLKYIAETELQNVGYSKGWYYEKLQAQNVLAALKPIKAEVEKGSNKSLFENVSCTSYMPLNNNRVCIFDTVEGNKIYAAFYSDKASSCEDIQNDHYKLYTYLLTKAAKEGYKLDMSRRWCGFYDFICNNTKTILVFHGMSSTYPHIESSEDLLLYFAEHINEYMDKWHTPDDIILITEDFEITKLS